MKAFNLILIVLIFIIFNEVKIYSMPTCDYQNSIYYLKKADRDYLRYFIFKNEFDSAIVSCQIGEFRILSTGNEIRVNISQTLDNCRQIQGDSTLGEDQTLLQYSRTEQFIMPESGQVKFFRRLSAQALCGINIPGPEPRGGGTGDWRDDHWHVGIGRILDNTEFIIQLVRATDATVLANIDSVGVAPNPNSHLAQRYGTDPDVMNHVRNLPIGYGGIPCYFRVSTRRWGATPYGVSFRINTAWRSQSHIHEYDSATTFRCDSSYYDVVEDHYANYLLNYLDSVKIATGKLPFYSGMPLSNFLDSVISARYYEMHIYNGDSIWTEIMDSSYYQKKGDYQERDDNYEQGKKSVFIEQISPQPITSGFIKILIKSNANTSNVIIEIYSVNGEKLKVVWRNSLFKGDNFATVNLSEFNPGIYIISLKNESGEMQDFMKIVITK